MTLLRSGLVSTGRTNSPTSFAGSHWVLFLAALVLGGCDHPESPVVTVRDSAGVRFTITEFGPLEFARLDTIPVLSLGGRDATGPRQFSRVQGVYLDPEGRLWVADGAAGEVRIFDGDGSHVLTTGGRGGGPGEFRQLRFLGPFHGDSMALWDAAAPRLTVLDPAGVLARTRRPHIGDEPTPMAHEVFNDGALLAQLPRIVSADAIEPGRVLADTVRLVRWELAGDRREAVAAVPGPLWLWMDRHQVPIPFTANPGFDVHDGAVYLAAGPGFQVRVYRGGDLREVFAVDAPPRAVTTADIEGHRRFVEDFVTAGPMREAYLSARDHPSVPGRLPGYGSVLLADHGAVWAGLYSPDPFAETTWHVFRSDGVWSGEIRMPRGFVPHSVRGSRIAGVWFDELGVEQVRVYRLR